MRLVSSFWVGALIRRCYASGAAAAVLRHGADEAGAIFLVVDRLDGTADFYGPAPQTAFDEAQPERQFQRLIEAAPPADIDRRIASETRFDPDLWVVAIEDREARPFVDLARG